MVTNSETIFPQHLAHHHSKSCIYKAPMTLTRHQEQASSEIQHLNQPWATMICCKVMGRVVRGTVHWYSRFLKLNNTIYVTQREHCNSPIYHQSIVNSSSKFCCQAVLRRGIVSVGDRIESLLLHLLLEL
jgi:UDP-N-acetylmuramoylalanine-D-glutamate ligase